MRIITLTCSDCGTVVAANELEERRIMKCPGLGCETVLSFDDLDQSDREHFLENREQYSLE
jgi:SUMO ligase MMS21 Smc5/6 complex component